MLLVGGSTFGLHVLRAALHLIEIRDIVVARDGATALRFLRTEQFSALLCDGELEAVDRMPFLVAVRRGEGVLNPMLPVFLISAAPRRHMVARAPRSRRPWRARAARSRRRRSRASCRRRCTRRGPSS